MVSSREYQRVKYHCTIDLLFDWFELVCFANKNKYCQLANSKLVKQEVYSTVIVFPVSNVRGFTEVGSVLKVEVTEVTNTLAY